MCNGNLHDSIHISILVHCALGIFATGKRVSHGGEYGLEIPTIFHFYGPSRPLNSAQNKIMKTEENLNKIVKHCPK